MVFVVKLSVRKTAVVLISLILGACSAVPISPPNTPSALAPTGPAAAHLASLWWVMLGLGAAIFILVDVLLAAALLRRRRGTSATPPDSHGGDQGRNWPIRGGIVLSLLVIAVVFGYSIYTLAVIENPSTPPAVKINVIGRRWWWEVDYPDQGVITANEIHIPVGKPVQIQLETGDVIHSFWVPQLHGKMDLIPNRINTLTIQSDQAGVFRGECAEFCGLQHAHMGFMVVAQNDADYNAWIAAQHKDAPAPADATTQKGQQVFVSAGCVFCHTVRGLEDKAIDRSGVDLGPDLTHLASRLTIAGASLSENKGNLAGWIIDTQHVKPGNLMPNMSLDSQDLQTLLDYLDSLQ
jgi:cytochrome c oxidase subunit II